MMDKVLTIESQEMTKLQSPVPENTSLPTVTTAEASSAETTTKTESPGRQQPQAGTMAMDITSFSTVHVQQSPASSKMRSLHLPHSASEPTPNPRKMMLQRSPAVRSTSSPPLPPEDMTCTESILQYGTTNTSFESAKSFDSGIEFPSRSDITGRTSKQSSFSRDNSFEYTDSTGTDLNEFIIKTLKNPRDRKFVMKLEHDFLNFIQDPLTIYINYPPMTSYHRMIVHRVAAYFGMDHNVDQQTGKSVIINKSITTRIPERRFADLVSLSREESEDSEGPKSILRRQNTPSGDNTPPKVDSPVNMMMGGLGERSKSIEEREKEYVEARQRIFNPGSRQSSQSSQSSKGDADIPHPQILTRDDFLQHGLSKVTPPRLQALTRPRSLDETTREKHARAGPGVRIMPNRNMLNRSSSSPGTSVAAAYAAEYSLDPGSPKGSHPQPFTIPAGGVQYWTADGMPVVATGMPTGEMMVQAQPGMVPVLNPGGAHTSGGMMWSVSPEAVPHGIMLINPNTGTPVIGHDGNPVIVQQTYQQMVLKPGQRYPAPQQKQQQPVVSQPSGATQYQQGGVVGQQMMMPPHLVSMPQPVYMVQQGRPPFNQPQMGNEGQPMSPSYQDISSPFSALTISGQPQEMDPAAHQQVMNEESSTPPSPMYGTSMSQGSIPVQPGQVQYVMVPPQSMHPQQFGSGQPGSPQMVPPQGPAAQHAQAYMVATASPYPQATPYQQQYGISKDMPHHARSQTPPTPPRTSSPVLAQAYNAQKVQMSSQSNQQSRNAAPFRQHTPPQTPSQVLQPMMPVVLSGNRAIPVGTTLVPNPYPGQGVSPHSTGMALPYQQPQVQVQTQYAQGQKKHNMDRRQKSSDMYAPDIMGVAMPGAPMGQFPMVYSTGGEPVSVMHMDRNQYVQYAQHRYGQVPVVGNPGYQYQPYPKPKSKQHHKKSQSPRSSSQSEQGPVERQSSTKSSDSEGAQGNVLEVYDLPQEIKNSEEDALFGDLKSSGAQIEWPADSADSQNTIARAVFPSPSAAEQALSLASNPKYKLRYPISAGQPCSSGTHAAVPSDP